MVGVCCMILFKELNNKELKEIKLVKIVEMSQIFFVILKRNEYDLRQFLIDIVKYSNYNIGYCVKLIKVGN